MGELTRFRLLRNPNAPCSTASRLGVPGPKRYSQFLADLRAALEPPAEGGGGNLQDRLTVVIAEARSAGGFATDGDTTAAVSGLIDELWAWFVCHPDAEVEVFTDWLRQWLDAAPTRAAATGRPQGRRLLKSVVKAGDWPAFVGLLEDQLLLLLAEASLAALTSGHRIVGRDLAGQVDAVVARLRLAWLVTEVTREATRLTDELVQRALTQPVVLPNPPFPLVPPAVLAGPPIVADLYVVRDEWARYVAGELAFIENVMPGEDRERSTRTTSRTETVIEDETIEVSREREETYESERTTEAEESNKQTNLEIGLQFQNDLDIKYGAVENTTKLGASLAFSRSEAQRRAQEIARESGRRAIEETERRVRHLRRVTTETTVHDIDAHRLSNTNEGEVRGVYRWVEKVQRYQLFRYPHRLQLEFFIPEPGKFLGQLLTKRSGTAGLVDVPSRLFLTTNGRKDGEPITVDKITPTTYLVFGATLGLAGLPPPPDPTLVITESLALSGGQRDKEIDSWELINFPPVSSGTKDVQLPDGYQATAWGASAAAAPELAQWRDWTDWNEAVGNDGVDARVGYHSIVAAVTVGSTNVVMRNYVNYPGSNPPEQEFNTVHVGRTDYRERWLAENALWWKPDGTSVGLLDLTEPLVGKLSFGATLGGAYAGTVSLTLVCQPTPETVTQWKTDVYRTLSDAVAARDLQIANAERTNRAQGADEVRLAVSPSVRKQLIRNELKRQLLDCLLGQRFDGYTDAPDIADSNGLTRPQPSFDTALAHGELVRFFEQSFEWDNMMHVLYPGYWAASSQWSRAVDFDSTDLELAAFLRAGAARVLVPARPKFEGEVFSFLELGLVMGGGSAFNGGKDESLSVADEIMALTRQPPDGEPGEVWEATVPTAMLWLDTGLSLPVENPAFAGPKA